MEELWKIEYYISPVGNNPVRDFINSLEDSAQVKIGRTLRLLSEFGIDWHSTHTKKLSGSSFWELRIIGTDSIRMLYIAKTGRTFLVLHGFKKKRQKIDRRALQVAMARWNEYCVSNHLK